MRIVINAWRDISHPLAGGSELMLDKLATGLHERGHDVLLCAGGPVAEHPYSVVDGGGRFDQYLRSPLRYVSGQRDADVVVDVANGMSFYTPLWRRKPTICLVHHVHTVHWAQWFPAPVAAFGRNLERHAMPAAYSRSLYVTVSPSSAESLAALGVDPKRIRIVENGMDAPEALAPKSAEPTFVALGRLVPHKRYDLLARVWKRVQPITGGRLLIAGDGPEADRIRAVQAPDLELLGFVSDEEKQRLLSRAWVLVHPSMLEGWGLVVMEAARWATPTLAFDAPGLRDSVVHARTGLLARSEAELADFWVEMVLDEDLRAKLGAGARERAQEFSWSATVDKFERVLEEAVEGGRLPRTRRNTRRMARTGHPAEPGPHADAHEPVVDPVISGELADDLAAAGAPATRRELLRLFLRERQNPNPFYRRLAERSVAQFDRELAGATVLDVGCGHGWDTRALRDAGASVVGVDLNPVKLRATGVPLPGSVVGDAGRLPFPDQAFDGVWCSNLLEHVPEPEPLIAEVERVLRPGGWAWLSWTNWWSPWGGHQITPFHYLGPRLGYRTRVRLLGEPERAVPFRGLWPTTISGVLSMVERRPGLRLAGAVPRYYPSQRWILSVPGLREVATWNCVLHLERVAAPA
ncbi:MAG: glycosyltransferase [Actinobacteria bacterium]|nr:glycosyltransferase [Actinomycetota bacterium]